MCWFTESIDNERVYKKDYILANIALQEETFTVKSLLKKIEEENLIDITESYVQKVVKKLQDNGKIYESFGSFIVK